MLQRSVSPSPLLLLTSFFLIRIVNGSKESGDAVAGHGASNPDAGDEPGAQAEADAEGDAGMDGMYCCIEDLLVLCAMANMTCHCYQPADFVSSSSAESVHYPARVQDSQDADHGRLRLP